MEKKEKAFTLSPSRKRHVMILSLCLVVLVVFTGLAFFRFYPSVDLNDYATITFSGADGFATAEFSFDEEQFKEDFAGRITYVDGYSDGSDPVEVIAASVDGAFDKESQLSNGDQVTWTWDIDEECFNKVSCRLHYEDMTVHVEGLKKAKTVDAFADISVKFTGLPPEVEAELVNESKDDACQMYDYVLSQEQGLDTGDKVEVRITEESINEGYEKYGVVPEKKTKSFVVDSLKDATEVDAFADVGLVCEGVSPVAHAKVLNKTKNSKLMGYEYVIDEDAYVANGDKVKVEIDEASIKRVFDEYKIVPKEKSKTFTVGGLEAYATELSQFSEQEKMEIVNAYVDMEAKSSHSNIAVAEAIPIGETLMTAKPDHLTEFPYNSYVVFVKVAFTGKNGCTTSGVSYDVVVFKNVVLDENGKPVLDKDLDWMGNRTSQAFSVDVMDEEGDMYEGSVRGYKTPEEALEAYATDSLSNYTFETNMD